MKWSWMAMMRMRAIDNLALPAGTKVSLKPGGHHLMLVDLKQSLSDGSVIPVTLLIKGADGKVTKQTVQCLCGRSKWRTRMESTTTLTDLPGAGRVVVSQPWQPGIARSSAGLQTRRQRSDSAQWFGSCRHGGLQFSISGLSSG